VSVLRVSREDEGVRSYIELGLPCASISMAVLPAWLATTVALRVNALSCCFYMTRFDDAMMCVARLRGWTLA
jgi:hypothetical protein